MEYNLKRFLDAQDSSYGGYTTALGEMRDGHKYNHWIWYIFPQMKGLGHSYNSQFYGIDGLEEAKAYLAHPVLGARLKEITEVVLNSPVTDVDTLMGSRIDAQKLKSSMTLFMAVAPEEEMFRKVLEKYFGGRGCGRTLRMVRK